MKTIFQVRDHRFNDHEQYKVVRRETYKKMIMVHDRAGQPVRVTTIYRDGHPVKSLTLL